MAALQTSLRPVKTTVLDARRPVISRRPPVRLQCSASHSSPPKTYRITLLPGDGIGPKVISVAKDVLTLVSSQEGIEFKFREMPVGGAALDAVGVPLPQETPKAAKDSDASLWGPSAGTNVMLMRRV